MSLIDDITGKTQADAAVEAAQIQSDAASAASLATQEATAQQRQDLQPFTQFGSSFIDPAQQAVAQSQELYGPNAGATVMNNPMFKALQNQAQTDIMQNAAVRGRLDTGGTQAHLQDSALRTGFDVLNQERNAALNNVGMFQNLVNQGQAAAAGQAGFTGQGNALSNDYLTSGAAATAAGTIGAANAQAAGTGNLLSLGTSLATGGLTSLVGAPKSTGALTGSGVGASNGLGGTINSPMGFGGA